MTFVFVWLTSLSMIISKSIHGATNGMISLFLWLSTIPVVVCNTPFFFFFAMLSSLQEFSYPTRNWIRAISSESLGVLATGPPGNLLYHIFFIHSSVDGHLGCFHVLAIGNSAAMNIEVHGSFWIMVFFRYMLRIKGKLIPILYNLFKKIEEGDIFHFIL